MSSATGVISWLDGIILLVATQISKFVHVPANNIFLVLIGIISFYVSSKIFIERDLKFFAVAVAIFLLLFLNRGAI